MLVNAANETLCGSSGRTSAWHFAGKRNVDGRRLGGFPLADACNAAIAAAGSGDTAGAQAGIKDMIKIAGITKIPPYGSAANPFAGGVSFTSMSGTTGTPGSW